MGCDKFTEWAGGEECCSFLLPPGKFVPLPFCSHLLCTKVAAIHSFLDHRFAEQSMSSMSAKVNLVK